MEFDYNATEGNGLEYVQKTLFYIRYIVSWYRIHYIPTNNDFINIKMLMYVKFMNIKPINASNLLAKPFLWT